MFLRFFDNISDYLILKLSKQSWLLYAFSISLCSLLFYIGIFNLPIIFPNEAKYALMTKNMLQAGDYFQPYLTSSEAPLKFIGYYWLQGLFVSIFDSSKAYSDIGFYRLSSVIGGLISVIAIIATTRRIFGREAAIFAGLLAPISYFIIQATHIVNIYAISSACIASGFYVLACLWRLAMLDQSFKFSGKHLCIFWTALIIDLLIGGAFLSFFICTVITLSIVKKDIKWLSPLKIHYGLIFICLLVLSILFLCDQSSGYILLQDCLWRQFPVQNILGFSFDISNLFLGIVQPFIMHFILLWPLSLLTPFAFILMWQRRKLNDGYIFILASVLPAWLLFDIFSLYPFSAIYGLYALFVVGISGIMMKFIQDEYDILQSKLYFIPALIYFALSCLFAFYIPFVLFKFQQIFDIYTIILSIISVIISVFVIIGLQKGFIHFVVTFLVLQVLLLVPNVFMRVIPQIQQINSVSVFQNVIEKSECSPNAVFIADQYNPILSLKFDNKFHYILPKNLEALFEKATPCSLFFTNNQQILNQSPIDKIKIYSLLNGSKTYFVYKR